MAIGRYPIPPPEENELEKNANFSPSIMRPPPGARQPSGGNNDAARPMAIFELLDYIVNEVTSPYGFDFSICLKVNAFHDFYFILYVIHASITQQMQTNHEPMLFYNMNNNLREKIT